MSQDNLEHELEILRQTKSQTEFIQILLARLDGHVTEEELDTLQIWLQVYGHKDERVIRYWQNILTGNDVWQQERALHNLFSICKTGSKLACIVYKNFLGKNLH
jgi:hypothetical protein